MSALQPDNTKHSIFHPPSLFLSEINTLTVLHGPDSTEHATQHGRAPIAHPPAAGTLQHGSPKSLQIVAPEWVLLASLCEAPPETLVHLTLVGADPRRRCDELPAVCRDHVCALGAVVGLLEDAFQHLWIWVPGRVVATAGAGGAHSLSMPEGEEAGFGHKVLRYARTHVPGVVHFGLQKESVVGEAGGVVVAVYDVVQVGFAFATNVGEFGYED
jgi:hypothetical protein